LADLQVAPSERRVHEGKVGQWHFGKRRPSGVKHCEQQPVARLSGEPFDALAAAGDSHRESFPSPLTDATAGTSVAAERLTGDSSCSTPMDWLEAQRAMRPPQDRRR